MYLVSLNYNNISYIVCFVADCGWTGGHGGFPIFGVIIMCVAIMERIDLIVVAVDGGRFRVRRDTNRMRHRSVPLFVPVIDSIIVVAS